MCKVFFILFAALFAAVAMLQSQDWMRGAVVVTSVVGEVIVEEAGGESSQIHATDRLPRAVSGLLQIRTKEEAAVFLKTSNRISIYNEGAGFFAIERFEQDVGTSMDHGKSRLIFNFRQGLVVVDNRALSDDSQMIVETPVGRISVKDGWWLMSIVYDRGSGQYYFSIECADGVLRFTKRNGNTYTLRNGQRLKGAGEPSRISIQVSETSEEAGELFEEFALMEASAVELELSSEIFLPKMKRLRQVGDEAAEPAQVAQRPEGSAAKAKRPLMIEYAPQSAAVTPFRAVIRAPSSSQADLF
tara:strand:- start:10316 stop:11218 length:903 start_codon:yes stop_codon:yes gene_type:complete